ncbi:elongation factor 1-alpha [Plakobranchus ocellatus]|uniref:Elongation factor 1-alpha n=1 Tax=Plakobranchus ocellatus TaxID=259542 RepID=A0AAV3ZI19_9GAST|nr:elongation factor 1-alpha [Plakobranchus ocellatus]
MSRHRMIRSMNYEDEYYDEEDEYSRSVEDNYCISPSTAAQFTWTREKNVNFASYMNSEEVIDEGDEDAEEDDSSSRNSLNDSANSARLRLSDVDQAKLNSCLEEARNILGESVSEAVMVDVIIQNQYNLEAAVNQLLTQQDVPKPQREPRQRRNRTQAPPASNSGFASATVTHLPDDNSTTFPCPTECMPSTMAALTVTTSGPTVVTPSASSAKGTIGFQEEDVPAVPRQTPSTSPVAGRKPGLKMKADTASLSSTFTPKTGSKKATGIGTALDVGDGEGTSRSSADSSLRSAVESMGLEGDECTIQASVDSMKSLATSKTRSKVSKLDVMAEYAKRHGDKDLLNLVVIGHVDAGKSTLMGHLLYQLGSVNKKTMHKYEQESKKLGKSSFAFAWVLDETEEERSRGVTMDVAQTRFETAKKIVTLLDAPGHKDFIPNMITGTSQADVAVLVINATRGEFETGFDAGGQTREHALLARSLGVGQIIVAVNKMDTVEWSQERYQLITKKLGQFLSRQAGFREGDVTFVPCSGLSGENLSKPPTVPELVSWYSPATTLVEQIDKLRPPVRPIDKPFRLNVSDVFSRVGSGFNVAGRVGSGFVQPGDKVFIMPAAMNATVKNVYIDDSAETVAFAGDHINMTLSGVDMVNVNIGSCLCDPAFPAKSATKIRAKIVIFSIDVPITKGFPVVFHYQSINEPAVIKRLLSQLNRNTGEVVKRKPRCLVKNSSASVEIELERSLCLELYTDFKDLGRFMLRSGGHTIAAGVVEEVFVVLTKIIFTA